MSKAYSFITVLMLLSLSSAVLADPQAESRPSSGISLKSSQSSSTLRLNTRGRPQNNSRQSIVITGGKSKSCIRDSDGSMHCDTGAFEEGD